ncbi:acetyltransferase [Candidatus Saccharibacteria bacterium]|nr:acetyltransferase [Candidatus Saccharibacteria bacterium]
MANSDIAFRKLAFKDINLLHKWLNTDFVQKWYGKEDRTYTQIRDKYSKYITGEKPTSAYIIQIDSHDIGYIQTYLVADYPKFLQGIQADKHSAGLDLYIGENEYIHKGYGKYIISKFLDKIVFNNSKVDNCMLVPETANTAAVKTYESVGFKRLRTVRSPDGDWFEYIMRLDKSDFKPL